MKVNKKKKNVLFILKNFQIIIGDAVYTGGFILHHYGREIEHCDVAQIEIHRSFRKNEIDSFEIGKLIGEALTMMIKKDEIDDESR